MLFKTSPCCLSSKSHGYDFLVTMKGQPLQHKDSIKLGVEILQVDLLAMTAKKKLPTCQLPTELKYNQACSTVLISWMLQFLQHFVCLSRSKKQPFALGNPSLLVTLSSYHMTCGSVILLLIF